MSIDKKSSVCNTPFLSFLYCSKMDKENLFLQMNSSVRNDTLYVFFVVKLTLSQIGRCDEVGCNSTDGVYSVCRSCKKFFCYAHSVALSLLEKECGQHMTVLRDLKPELQQCREFSLKSDILIQANESAAIVCKTM